MTSTPEDRQTAPSASQSDEAPLARPKDSTPHRCALYARSSVGSPYGAGAQLASIRDYAAQKGWEVVEEFPEERTAVPGPVFQRMLDGAAEAGITHVVIAELGALGSQHGPAQEHARAVADHGLALVIVRDGASHGPAALKLAAGLLDAVAEYDSRRIAEERRYRRRAASDRMAGKAQEIGDAPTEVEADWGPPDDQASRGERDQAGE